MISPLHFLRRDVARLKASEDIMDLFLQAE